MSGAAEPKAREARSARRPAIDAADTPPPRTAGQGKEAAMSGAAEPKAREARSARRPAMDAADTPLTRFPPQG